MRLRIKSTDRLAITLTWLAFLYNWGERLRVRPRSSHTRGSQFDDARERAVINRFDAANYY
jgi:hypothetical protein